MKQDLSGLPVKCPNCKRVMFKTTIKFNPNETPRGDFVESLAKYQIDWLCSSTTLASEMTCPECCAQLVLNGRLTVLIPIRDVGDFFDFVTEEVAAAKAQLQTNGQIEVHDGAQIINPESISDITPERVEEDTYIEPEKKEPKKKQSKKKSHK